MGIAEEVSRLENSIRALIEDVLRAVHGDAWISRLGVTNDRIEKWITRVEEERKHSTGAVVEGRLLFYADFPDLKVILRKNWEVFKPCFGDLRETEVYLDRLSELRNPTAHSRPVLQHEELLAEGMSRELRQKITVFRNSGAGGPEPEHFCRIEEVSDSFGLRARGQASADQIVDTRPHITLRPGDVVSFRASAIDPQDRPIRWTVASPFRGGGGVNLAGHVGPTLELTWEVAEGDIHEQLEIIFAIASVVGPHRFGNQDDEARFLYRVLPSR